MAQAQFESLLSSLMSEDQATRQQAEKMFMNTKKQQPSEVVQALLQVGRTSSAIDLRSLAIVLLRRALINLDQDKSLYKKCNPQVQELLKEQLLQGMEKEESSKVRSDFCEAACSLASDIFESEETWDGLVERLVSFAQSSGPSRLSALTMFANLAPYVKTWFEGNFPVLMQVLQQSLAAPEMVVRVEALYASQHFILVFTEPQYRRELQSLIAPILDIIAACLNVADEDSAQTALRHLITLSEEDPGFFQPSANIVANAMLKICMADQLDDPTRQLSLEFLVSLAENRPKMCMGIDNFIKNLIYTLVQWMLDMPDISLEEWNTRKENEDDEIDVENSVIAQESLDRICLALSGDQIGPIIFEHIPSMTKHEDWKQRHVALMSLSMIGEGCYEVFEPLLGQIVGLLLPLFHDPHPRVRWAAANAAGQMSTDFGPQLQKQFHADFFPRFIDLLGDNQNPKVQSHTAAALINFCEKFSSKAIKPYLNDLLSKLLTLLKETNNMEVQEQVLTAVASIAGCSEKNFADYYNSFAPVLKEIILNASGKDQRMLRGKAMECLSLIGVAVGKEQFAEDAQALMQLSSTINVLELEPDDPLRDFIYQMWMRISSCLGKDFAPFLPMTMPLILRSIAAEASFTVEDAGIINEDVAPGWDVLDVGDTRLKIHTMALEEKANACTLVLCFASEMKEAFFPYVQEVSTKIAPLLSFNFHDGVRAACCGTVPHLLNCVKPCSGQEKNLSELFKYLFPPLIESMRDDTDTDCRLVAIEAVHESLAVMEENTLSLEEVQEMVTTLCCIIQLSINTREGLLGQNPDNDEDVSTLTRDEIKLEDDLMVEIAEVVGALVKYHPDFFMEAFSDTLFSIAGALIQNNRAPAERQLALCIFDDIVEHGKEKSFALWNSFMPFLLEYAVDEHVGVRQAACYGLGVCAEKGLDQFKQYTKKALELLISVVTKADARNDRNASPTENAISSVGKIIHFQAAELGNDVQQLVNMWVSWLPLEMDEIEAAAVHEHFFNFITSNHPNIFGTDFSNLPKILSIFAFLLIDERPLVKDKKFVVGLLKHMCSQMPQDLLEKASGPLTPEQRAVMQSALAE